MKKTKNYYLCPKCNGVFAGQFKENLCPHCFEKHLHINPIMTQISKENYDIINSFKGVNVEVEEDHVTVYENDVEIVHWTKDEWVEDPEFVVPAICNAIHLAYTNINKLKKLVKITKISHV